MKNINIVPAVKEYKNTSNKVKFDKINCSEVLSCYEVSLLNEFTDKEIDFNLFFLLDESLNEEAYKINICSNKIDVYYSTSLGKHNAVLTLVQLLRNINILCECTIFDEPDFSIRSIMIDISRNKVPKVETLKKIVDEVSLVKINEIQLYVEGRSFYFESFAKYYDNKEDFLTGEDVLELTKYCNERNVKLIPNINCFGHMAYWVNQPDLKHLGFAEKFYWEKEGLRGYVVSIDPKKEEACKMLYQMFDDMLKYYPDVSEITIGGDEPFDLLFPEKLADSEQIYEEHISNVIRYVKDKGLTPWMWGDVVKLYPELLKKLDANFLEWGYDKGQFNDNNCSFYKKNNKNFIVCCGTSCWNNFAGRMDNMFANYYAASYYGKKYGAKGMMITDWNDGGSLSQIPTNLLCYVYGACYAWNLDGVNHDIINKYLDDFVYLAKLSSSVVELGRYNTCEDLPHATLTKLFIMYYCHQMEGINYDIKSYSDCTALFNRNTLLNKEECLRTKEFLDNWIKDFKFDSDNQYCKELMFVYKLIRHVLNANIVYLKLRNIDCSIEEINDLINDINYIINEYDLIWHYRNKESDYYYSVRRLKMLRYRYNHILTLMKGDF